MRTVVSIQEYTTKEIDAIYSAVEDAVNKREPVDVFTISEIIKPGDFYLRGAAANGLVFMISGLKWVEDGRIYTCLLQPRVNYGAVWPEWYPVITIDDREGCSSGDLSMIKRENRYLLICP